jgi:ribonuclease P protein component
VKSHGFPRSRRLQRPQDFQRVYDDGQRAGDEFVLIFAAPSPCGSTRIGLSVSRKHGNSVVRHRVKRLLREAYRLSQLEVPEGLDLVLIPRPGCTAGVKQYRMSIVALSQRLARRLQKAAAPATAPAQDESP